MNLVVTQLIRPMKPSGTGAWLVKCNDDQNYVLKFFNGKDNSLSNEFICNKIAKSMGLTIPEAAIISITKDNADAINATRNKPDDFLISSGKYFGTKFIENAYTLDHEIHRKLKPSKIKNIDEVPGMIIFDLFVENWNRSKDNVLLHVLSEEQQVFEYVLIDHGHCFGGLNWNVNSIESFQPKLFEIPWKHNFFISQNQFKKHIEKLKNLDKEFFKKIIDEIPIEWKKNPEEYDTFLTAIPIRDANKILSLLKIHKQGLIIWNLRRRFPQFDRCLACIENAMPSYVDQTENFGHNLAKV